MGNQKRLVILINEKTNKEIHNMMNMVIESDGIVIYRMTEANNMQTWYRELLRMGIRQKIIEFSKTEKKIKDENNNEN